MATSTAFPAVSHAATCTCQPLMLLQPVNATDNLRDLVLAAPRPSNPPSNIKRTRFPLKETPNLAHSGSEREEPNCGFLTPRLFGVLCLLQVSVLVPSVLRNMVLNLSATACCHKCSKNKTHNKEGVLPSQPTLHNGTVYITCSTCTNCHRLALFEPLFVFRKLFRSTDNGTSRAQDKQTAV